MYQESPLIMTVYQHSTTNLSGIHGTQHWRAVARAGARLLAECPDADRVVVFFFALFHDAKRQNDGYDPEHGLRAATLARELLSSTLTTHQLDTLTYALEWHDKGQISDDPTIGVCWDSDRLNLWRVRIKPNPRLLSTPAARQLFDWARNLYKTDLPWREIAVQYGIEVSGRLYHAGATEEM